MRKSQITTIVIFAVLGILILAYFIFKNTDDKHYQWFANYKADNKQPYGTLFIRQMLENYKPGGRFVYSDKKPIKDVLRREKNSSNTNYVFIGQSLYLDASDTDALLNFINSGNDAFIATLDLPTSIIYRFYSNECNKDMTFEYYPKDIATFNFYHDSIHTEKGYSYAYRFGSEDVSFNWDSFNSGIFCDSTKLITPLGYLDPDHVNFVKLSYGKGNLYIHSNPLLFTNYFLIKPDKVEYASSVFSHLSGKNIIWDEYSKVPFLGNNNVYDSPLYYILQQPSLKYAWWLMILSVLLYVLFAAKRTQRVIPVLEKKTNTSLEYIHMISSLHFKNGNHRDMFRKKIKYFLYFIRSKYGIQAQSFKEEHIEKLAEKSKVSLENVKRIYDLFNLAEHNPYYNIETGLVDLNHAIDNFYKQCK